VNHANVAFPCAQLPCSPFRSVLRVVETGNATAVISIHLPGPGLAVRTCNTPARRPRLFFMTVWALPLCAGSPHGAPTPAATQHPELQLRNRILEG
jgi:hypothetical protein